MADSLTLVNATFALARGQVEERVSGQMDGGKRGSGEIKGLPWLS